MVNGNQVKAHPKGLYILFTTEMWERFNYYGMRAILVLFMTKALMYDKTIASQLYGSYTSLSYLTPLLGGFMADRYFGNKRSIIAGGLTMALGEFILFFCASTYSSNPQLSTFLFFSGLGFMIAGNGFFKANIASLVGQLYPPEDRRIDPAYTIFYMGINVGGALGPFLCGFFGDTGNPVDFKWAFLVAGIGMLLSVLVQVMFNKKYLINPQGKEIGMEPENTNKKILNPIFIAFGLAVFSSVMVGLFYFDAKIFPVITYLLIFSLLLIIFIVFGDSTLSALEKKKVLLIFIVTFFVVFFWSAFEQAGASLTFFADEQTDRQLGLNIPGWVIYVISAIAIIYITRLFSTAKKKLSADDILLRNVVYVLLGILTLGLVYGNVLFYQTGLQELNLDVIPASFFQSLNSTYVVIFAPIFAWFWIKLGKYDPSSPTKMAIGLLLLALGYLWIAIGVKGVQPGIKVSMMWLAGLYMLHTWGELCLSPIGLSLVSKMAPLKLASLMMAVWYLANAFANKLAGQLSALYPDGKTTHFLGFTMHNMYDFFILFVILSGTASILLFLLTRWLQKLM